MSDSFENGETARTLQRALVHATEHLAGLDTRSVAATLSLAELRAQLDVGLRNEGVAPSTVIDELVEATRGGHLGCAGGRFYGWVIGGALPSALAADWMTSTWDQNAAIYACGPAAAVAEEIAGEWVKDVLDLPRDASFAFTTGCQLAHFTCLAAARHAVFKAVGWDVEADGLIGAPRLRILSNDQLHGSTIRAVRFLGLGHRAIETLDTGNSGRIDPALLERKLAESSGPTILVLDAGDLNIGAFDDFTKLIPLTKKHNAWVHVDGAFGLWARASKRHAHLAAGIELADSWATDAHKWLNTPKDCGIAIVRDRAAHRATMTLSASYIPPNPDARDQFDWTPEWTRRARGFVVYAALRELGRDGIADLIDRSCDHARVLTAGIGALPGAEMVAMPTLNQGLVRFLAPDANATDADHDRRTDAVMAAINASGEAYFSGTTWKGRRAMRISVCNWRTTANDIRRAIEAARQALERSGK